MPLAPMENLTENLLAPNSEEPPATSESQRFESSFRGLSRVNDSLMKINLVQRGIATAKGAHGESETGTRPAISDPAARLLLRVGRLGVADHALHGGKGAAQRALDLVDV